MKLESRVRQGGQIRASSDEFSLVGYAAMFNVLSHDLGGFKETIQPGAFTRALQEKQDVRCLFNHAADKILGRTSSGTLSLEQDERGLKFRCQLDPKQQFHKDLYASIQRGDVKEMSFAFSAPKEGQEWADAQDERGQYFAQRTLKDVDLFDISPVVYPAYPSTQVAARDLSPSVLNALDTLDTERWRRAMSTRADAIGREIADDRARDVAERSQKTGFIWVKNGPGEFDGFFDAMTLTEVDRHLQRRAAELGEEIRLQLEAADRAEGPTYDWDFRAGVYKPKER